MPKPYRIVLTCEEIALGTNLRKLHEMPGIVSVDLDLGLGGNGPGRERLADAAKLQGGSTSEKVIRLLANGPMKRSDIRRALGVSESSINTAIATLKQNGFIGLLGRGIYQLNAKQSQTAPPAPPLLLPPPRKSGRTERGAAQNVMLVCLTQQSPMERGALGEKLRAAGVPGKSITNMMSRAIRDKLIKRSGKRHKLIVELTAKGAAVAAAEGVAAHG